MESPARRVRGLFVTGTDTGVGKTVVSAAIVAGLVSLGFAVRPLKPLITGLDEPQDPIWPPDHEQLARVVGLDPDDVALLRYGPAVSPHLAAELTGEAVRPGELEGAIRGAVHDGEVAVVEGAGGLLVPIAPDYDMRELAAALAMPLVVVARPGLGTINHTLLTLEAARARGLSVAGVVLNPWPAEPDEIERSNRATIEQLGEVTVSVFPRLDSPDPAALSAAGGRLPLERWLA